MKWNKSEIIEYKRPAPELKEAVISITATLNKHQRGGLYVDIKNNSAIVGQAVGEAISC